VLTLAVVVLSLVVWYFGHRIVRAVEISKATSPREAPPKPNSEVSRELEEIRESRRAPSEHVGESENTLRDHFDFQHGLQIDESRDASAQMRELQTRLEDVKDHLVGVSAELFTVWVLCSRIALEIPRAANAPSSTFFFPCEKDLDQPASSFMLNRAVSAAIRTTDANSTRHMDEVEQVTRAFLSDNEYDENALRSVILGKLEALEKE
jgi:hypothetical protein